MVSGNVRMLRERRGLTRPQLSERLSDLGRPLLATGLAKIEDGTRRVDVDDLMALAIALNVSPPRLLLPSVASDEPVRLTPKVEVSSSWAWSWAEGEGPVSPDFSEEEDEAYHRERPAGLRSLSQNPVMRSADYIRTGTARLLRSINDRNAPDRTEKYLRRVRREMQVLATELDRLEDEVNDRG